MDLLLEQLLVLLLELLLVLLLLLLLYGPYHVVYSLKLGFAPSMIT